MQNSIQATTHIQSPIYPCVCLRLYRQHHRCARMPAKRRSTDMVRALPCPHDVCSGFCVPQALGGAPELARGGGRGGQHPGPADQADLESIRPTERLRPAEPAHVTACERKWGWSRVASFGGGGFIGRVRGGGARGDIKRMSIMAHGRHWLSSAGSSPENGQDSSLDEIPLCQLRFGPRADIGVPD